MVLNLWKILGGTSATGNGRLGSSVKPVTKNNIAAEWRNIEILVSGGQPSQLRQALIQADKSLDNALRDLVKGETMGERLKNSSSLFDRSLYDKIWKAHKMRNALVHESGYEPPHQMLKNNVETFKNALSKLGVTAR
jgi:hypothetical protein